MKAVTVMELSRELLTLTPEELRDLYERQVDIIIKK